jgi:hypothetical protein
MIYVISIVGSGKKSLVQQELLLLVWSAFGAK